MRSRLFILSEKEKSFLSKTSEQASKLSEEPLRHKYYVEQGMHPF